jgi:prepilin-type N-terminal cleavage/methylation domain-containing protein
MNKNISHIIKDKNLNKGFTLIELLIVIVIITALAVTVFVAFNPVKRIKDAHDSRRAADVETILTAIHESIVDNNGTLPAALQGLTAGTMYMIGTCASGCGTAAANYSPNNPPASFQCAGVSAGTPVNSTNLATQLSSYLKALPNDPIANGTGQWASTTGYAITVATGNIITVTACYPEDTASISQSR